MSCLCVHKSLRLGNNLFSRYVPIDYNTRLGGGNNVNAYVPNILSVHSRQSLRWVGSSNWNSLPQHLREIQEYNTFKIRLKKYLINGWLFSCRLYMIFGDYMRVWFFLHIKICLSGLFLLVACLLLYFYLMVAEIIFCYDYFSWCTLF